MNEGVVFDSAYLGHSRSAPALGPLTFSLREGTLTSLVGPNGSGKSTMIKALVGESFLIGGSIRIFGKTAAEALRSGDIGYVPQDPVFSDHLSVHDLVALGLFRERRFLGKDSLGDERVGAILDDFGLTPLRDRRANTLSIGERQRAMLARAVVQRPRLLLLDEPTNHLDPTGQKQFWTLLREQQSARGLSAVIATHDYHRAQRFSDTTIALKDGRLAAVGASDSFWSGPAPHEIFGDYE